MTKKTAVVLFNLGGPDSKAAIKPFLFNFFTDPNIIRLPYIFRWFIAKLIASRRSKREAGTSYGELGDKSPLLENSQAQAVAVEKLLNDTGLIDYKTFICMRYWHPMADEVVKNVKEWNPDNIVLLPLYPQYSTTRFSEEALTQEKTNDVYRYVHLVAAPVRPYPSMEHYRTAAMISQSANLLHDFEHISKVIDYEDGTIETAALAREYVIGGYN